MKIVWRNRKLVSKNWGNKTDGPRFFNVNDRYWRLLWCGNLIFKLDKCIEAISMFLSFCYLSWRSFLFQCLEENIAHLFILFGIRTTSHSGVLPFQLNEKFSPLEVSQVFWHNQTNWIEMKWNKIIASKNYTPIPTIPRHQMHPEERLHANPISCNLDDRLIHCHGPMRWTSL